ncbi:MULTISPECIES: sugar nucleotide-binding protein [unclassified Clostridium]|uniref:SDR family oxidoreductase n=1 Tax=unclassified Clostridium TaxID=2614128 RepID=UPI000297E8C8|nr:MULTISPECIES: sugar nucleotide-binding protein [unclassified Clostridium]EKQ53052.1 MAG: dTDP-4-dehydrorhamnose reductase [Clostridium sp. Maddingley MBC34-26]
MEKILITGGKGFFSSRLALYYKGKYEFLVTDKDELDITNEGNVNEIFEKFNPNIVIHAAAVAVTDFCNKNPEIAHKINVDGAINVAKATKKVGGKLVFISSEQIFNGNTNSGPFKEDDEAKPDTVYGQNKLEAEKLLKEIIDELWIVRFTWLFGLPDRNCGMANNILWETISKIIKNEKINVSSNEFRGMTYVYNMIENFEILFKSPYGTYHLGSENNQNRYEVVKSIFRKIGLESRIDDLVIEDREKYKTNPRDIRLNCEKARSVGMKFYTTDEALDFCIKEYGMKF